MNWLDNVKRIKNKLNITNEELSQSSRIPTGTLNKLLSGQTASIKLETLEILANALNVSVHELIGGGNDISDDESKVIEMLREIDGDDYDKIYNSILGAYNRAIQRKKRMSSVFVVEEDNTRQIILYDAPVSAGRGNYLDSECTKKLTLALNELTDRADYALRVRGDSMEPRYSDGDIVIVESGSEIEQGKIGIFILNGESYIKKYYKDRLVSLNPKYSDIYFTDSDSIECKGIVLGRLRSS